MSEKVIMKGNEALAEAAIRAGCKCFFGYPITPQTEVAAYMSKRMAKAGGVYLQAESEVAAINMVYGAAATGTRCMTSSSSPGISLKSEGISYLIGADLPAVIVNMVRGGPGLGSIQPAQSDYYQSTRGGGHGDYRMIVLAPSSVQEAVELTQQAFDLADMYRNPVLIMGDGLIGQMMEPVEMPDYQKPADLPEKTWAATGWKPGCGRDRAVINSLYIDPNVLEQHNRKLFAKYAVMEEKECRWQEEMTEDADYVIVAYGTTARICRSAMRKLREKGITIIYISHRLDEVFDLCNNVSVLRDGQHIETLPIEQITRQGLINMMVGREMGQEYPKAVGNIGDTILEVKDLNCGILKDISFHVKAGEVFGISGLVGAGRTELARAILGIDKIESGEVFVRGKKVKYNTFWVVSPM